MQLGLINKMQHMTFKLSTNGDDSKCDQSVGNPCETLERILSIYYQNSTESWRPELRIITDKSILIDGNLTVGFPLDLIS